MKNENKNLDYFGTKIFSSISNLKDELKHKKKQDDLERNYLYSSLVDTKKNEANFFPKKIFPSNQDSTLQDSEALFNISKIKSCFNNAYESDKFEINKILIKNEERLKKLNMKEDIDKSFGFI
jgi:hypothetical protein